MIILKIEYGFLVLVFYFVFVYDYIFVKWRLNNILESFIDEFFVLV